MTFKKDNLLKFNSRNRKVGDIIQSIYAVSDPNYVDMTKPSAPYLKSSYPELAKIVSPDVTPVAFSTTSLGTGLGTDYQGFITYANNTWICLPGSLTSTYVTYGLRSIDNGVTWSHMPMAALGAWSGIAYGNGIWVAVSNSVQGPSFTTSTNCGVSYDNGMTWTLQTMPSSQAWSKVAYGNGVFVAIAGASNVNTSVAAVSKDGITWRQKVLPGVAREWTNIIYANGSFIAMNSYGQFCAKSTDNGETWVSKTISAGFNDTMGAAYGDGVIVGVGGGYFGSGTRFIRSTDYGETWTQIVAPVSAPWWGVAYGSGVFIAIAGSFGSASNSMLTSIDGGITWTSRTMTTTQYWQGFAYGKGKFIATPGYGTTSGSASNTLELTTYSVNPTKFSLPDGPIQTGATAYIKVK